MADATYSPKVYRDNGGDRQVVASGGVIKIETGGKVVPNSGTQAANIADVSTATVAWTVAEKGRINTLLAALEGVGILATS